MDDPCFTRKARSKRLDYLKENIWGMPVDSVDYEPIKSIAAVLNGQSIGGSNPVAARHQAVIAAARILNEYRDAMKAHG